MRFDLDAVRATLTAKFPLVNDHPDVAGLLRDPLMLPLIGQALAYPFRGLGVTTVIAPEARGPILGALAAVELGAGLVLARKDDRNHPGADIPVESGPTWRGRREVFKGRSFDIGRDDHVLIVDDWITTGSTIRAISNIVTVMGAECVGTAVLVNKATAATLGELDVHFLVRFADIADESSD